eukprot:4930241-Pleurochrysis_carterae.AAC.1
MFTCCAHFSKLSRLSRSAARTPRRVMTRWAVPPSGRAALAPWTRDPGSALVGRGGLRLPHRGQGAVHSGELPNTAMRPLSALFGALLVSLPSCTF